MARPRVKVTAPSVVQVGQPFQVTAEIATESEAKVEHIDIKVTGNQGWVIGSGKSRARVETAFPELAVRVMSEGVLGAGQTQRFSASFTLPPGTALTHDEAPAHAALELRVHVAMPWRIDIRHDEAIVVRVPAPADVARTPIVVASPPQAVPGTPRIELALGSTRVVAGEVLRGTCAVFHMEGPREVTISLVPVFELHGHGRVRQRDGDAVRSVLRVDPGKSTPFAVQLPATMLPSFTAVTHTVTWRLEARTGSFFGTKLAVAAPLEVMDASATLRVQAPPRPPQLADERTLQAFAAVAASDDADLLPAGNGVIQEVPEGTLTVEYSDRGEAGAALVGRVDHPGLGLGLAVTPGSAWRHMFLKDVEIDPPAAPFGAAAPERSLGSDAAAWDRAHHVDARSAEQTIPFLRAVLPMWAQAQPLGTFMRWRESELVFELPVTGIDVRQVRTQLGTLAQLARAIEAARPLIAPPPGIATDVAAWRALAVELEGRFTAGDLSLDGVVGGLPVAIAWSGGSFVHATIGSPGGASATLGAIQIAIPHPAVGTGNAVIPPAVYDLLVDLLVTWPPDIVDLRVNGGVARASLACTTEIPVPRVRALVDLVRSVIAVLDATPGPDR